MKYRVDETATFLLYNFEISNRRNGKFGKIGATEERESKILRASEKTRGSVESFSGELKHAWAHSRELETARVEVRGERGRNGVVGVPGGIEQRLDEISGIIKST